MSHYSLKIPVNDYEYKMLCYMLKGNKFIASYNNTYGKLIFNSYNDKDIKPCKINRKGHLIYEVLIPYDWMKERGITFIDTKSIEDFIKVMDSRFKNELYNYLDGVAEVKQDLNKNTGAKLVIKLKTYALKFLENKGFLEDTIKFETIKKGYQRHRDNFKTYVGVVI